MQLTISEMKVMWVVGATERLATLGLLSPNIPMQLTADAVDYFIEIDNHRNLLFSCDFEIEQIFKVMAKAESCEEVSDYVMDRMVELILEYKNNRTELVKKALSYQTM
jgi:L-rhamnose mutarotase